MTASKAIYVLNKSTTIDDVRVKAWCKAVEWQLRHNVAPGWGYPPLPVKFRRWDLLPLPKGAWVVVILDDADQADALGYHSVDRHGRVYGRVFARTAKNYGENPSVTFSHEVLEMYGDPQVHIWARDPLTDNSYPVELCDAVQGETYIVNGVEVSNFLFPAWFGLSNANPLDGRLDFLRMASGPFCITSGGYTVERDPDGTLREVFGERVNITYMTAKGHELGRFNRRCVA